MMRFLKINLLKTLIIACLMVFSLNGNAWAVSGDNTCPFAFNMNPTKPKGTSSKAPREVKEAYAKMQQYRNEALALCKNACRNEKLYCTDSDQEKTMKADGTFSKYESLVEAFKEAERLIKNSNSKDSCGYKYPYGCPDGYKCYMTKSSISNYRGGMNASVTTSSTDVDFECLPEGTDVGKRQQTHFNQDKTVVREATEDEEKTRVTNLSSSATGLGSRSELQDDGDVSITTTYAGGDLYTIDFDPTEYDNPVRSNSGFCKIKELQDDYMSTCYSCVIVSALIRTFMIAVEVTAPLTQAAGIKLLAIGMLLWIAVYVLQKVSSFVSLEPMKMLQELFTFFFKCGVAYLLIVSGLHTIVANMVNPILGAGAEYGIGIIDSVTPETVEIDGHTSKDSKVYKLVSSNIIDQKVFNKIMTVSKKADGAVSLNFVIGDALMCHSFHAGAIQFAKKVTDLIGIEFFFPDIWLWLCGALIWFFALMVVIGVNFYLLDLSFKIGFALLALPITIGLWPFNKFKDQFTKCFKIILNAAGTFLFLGVTTGMSIVLISAGVGGTDRLFNAIENDDKVYISQQFGFTSGKFLLVFFAFLYSHKLISETVSKLTDKFFPSDFSGITPMHHMTTQMIDMAKNAAVTVAGGVAGGVGGAVGKVASKAASGVARGAVSGARKGGSAVGKGLGTAARGVKSLFKK